MEEILLHAFAAQYGGRESNTNETPPSSFSLSKRIWPHSFHVCCAIMILDREAYIHRKSKRKKTFPLFVNRIQIQYFYVIASFLWFLKIAILLTSTFQRPCWKQDIWSFSRQRIWRKLTWGREMTSCDLLEMYWRFVGTLSFYLQSRRWRQHVPPKHP
jgi:hypothetical protein